MIISPASGNYFCLIFPINLCLLHRWWIFFLSAIEFYTFFSFLKCKIIENPAFKQKVCFVFVWTLYYYDGNCNEIAMKLDF